MTRKQRRIVELIAAAPHMTADDVAKTLRVARQCVYWACRRHGLKCAPAAKTVNDADRRRIKSMANAKIPDIEIAKRLGFSTHCISRHRRRLGIKRPGFVNRGHISRAKQIEMVRMHVFGGKTYGEIAKVAGVTRSCVAGIVHRARKQRWNLTKSVEKEAEAV